MSTLNDMMTLGQDAPPRVVTEEAAERAATNRAFAYGVDKEVAKQDILLNGTQGEVVQQTEAMSVDKQRQNIAKGVAQNPLELLQEPNIETVLKNRYATTQPDLQADMDEEAALIPVTMNDVEQEQAAALIAERQLKLQDDPIYKNEQYQQQVKFISELKDLEYGEFATELGLSALPMHIDSLYIGLRNHMFPDKPFTLHEGVSSGKILEEMKDHIKTLPKEERLQWFEDAWRYLKDDSLGWIADNEPALFFTIQELMEDEISGEEHSLAEWMNGFASVIDKITVTAAVGNPVGFLSGLTRPFVQVAKLANFAWGAKSPMRSISTVNPEAAEDIMRLAKEDPDVVRTLGVDPEDLVTGALSSDGVRIAQSMIDEAKRSAELSQELINNSRINTHIFQPEDLQLAKDGLKKILNKQYPAIHNPSVKFGDDVNIKALDDENTLGYTAYVGADNKHGFSTILEAKQSAKRFITDEGHKNLEFFKKNMHGEFEKVDPSATFIGKGDFFYQIKGEVATIDALKKGGKKLGPEDITKSSLHRVVMEGVKDNAAMYSRPISRWLDSISNETAAFSSAMKTQFEPFIHASTADQIAVISKLSTLRAENKPFTARWVLDQGFTEAQAKAAWAYKTTSDVMHNVLNDRMYRKLFGDGFKHLKIKTAEGGLEIAGRLEKVSDVPWASIQAGDKTITGIRYYDPDTGTLKTLSKSEAEELEKNGSSLYRVNEDLRSGNSAPGVVGPVAKQPEVSNYVIVKQSDKVHDLPKNVLNYNPSYVAPQIYDKPIFLRIEESVLRNGNPESYIRAISAHDNHSTARAAREDYLANNPGVNPDAVKVTFAKELGSSKELNEAQQQILEAQGRLFYSKRAEKRIDGLDGDTSLHVDYADAMMKGIDSVASIMVRSDSLEHLKRMWANTYGQGGKYPKSLEELNTTDKGARILYNKIEAISSFKNSQEAEWQRLHALKAAEFLGNNKLADVPLVNTITNTAAKGALVVAKNPADSLAKGLGFRLFILSSPVRQLFIQSQQFMFLSPLVGHRMVPAMTNTALVLAELAARKASFRPSTREGSQLLKELRNSGLLDTIDLHAHMDGMLAQHTAATKSIGRQAVELADKPFQILGAGFRGGEGFNRLASWMVARERFFMSNGKYPKTKRELQSVNSDASQLTLAVTKDSAYNWQNGITGVFTQFLSIQAKAMSAFSPYGSRAFTKGEKFRIALGQGLFFGLQGFGLAALVDNYTADKGITMSPEARAAVTGGLVDYLAYKNIGEHVKIAESTAPAGGVMHNMVDYFNVLSGIGHKSFFDVPPSSQAAGRLVDAWDRSKMLFFGSGEVSAGGKLSAMPLEDFVDGMAMITSGWNNYAKARTIDTYESLVSKRGDPLGVDLNDKALALIGALGFRTQAEEDFYRMNKLLKGTGGGDKPKHLQATAVDYAKTLKGLVTRIQLNPETDNPRSVEGRINDEVVKQIDLLNNTLDAIAETPDDALAMKVAAHEWLKEHESQTFNVLVTLAMEKIEAGLQASEDEVAFAAHIAKSAAHLSEDEQETIQSTLLQLIKDGNLRMNPEDLEDAFNK